MQFWKACCICNDFIQANFVITVKRLQKLGDDEHGEVSRSYGGTKSKRKKIVFKLERARKRKQRVKGLHAAFQKRFFAFNPDKHQGSLKGKQQFVKNHQLGTNALKYITVTKKCAKVHSNSGQIKWIKCGANTTSWFISAGIPLEKHNALFQSGSAQKAAAAELKKRRDSVLQQPGGSDVELMPVPSSKGRSK